MRDIGRLSNMVKGMSLVEKSNVDKKLRCICKVSLFKTLNKLFNNQHKNISTYEQRLYCPGKSKPVCKAKFIGAICRKRNPKFKVEQ